MDKIVIWEMPSGIMEFYPFKPTEPENARALTTLGGAHKELSI